MSVKRDRAPCAVAVPVPVPVTPKLTTALKRRWYFNQLTDICRYKPGQRGVILSDISSSSASGRSLSMRRMASWSSVSSVKP